jgi:hypothetical protein
VCIWCIWCIIVSIIVLHPLLLQYLCRMRSAWSLLTADPRSGHSARCMYVVRGGGEEGLIHTHTHPQVEIHTHTYTHTSDISRHHHTYTHIKDKYVVCKYAKKTVLELGFIWVWVLDTCTCGRGVRGRRPVWRRPLLRRSRAHSSDKGMAYAYDTEVTYNIYGKW